MPSFQSVTVMGHLGKDPELSYTPNGTAVCKFSLAASEQWTDKNGEKKEKTEWFNVAIWDKLAETAAKFLHKGACVLVVGKLETREYADRQTGEKKRWTDLIAHTVRFVQTDRNRTQDQAPTSSGGPAQTGSGAPPPSAGGHAPYNAPPAGGGWGGGLDDIPF